MICVEDVAAVWSRVIPRSFETLNVSRVGIVLMRREVEVDGGICTLEEWHMWAVELAPALNNWE